MLVELSCGAALSAIYGGTIARLQQEGVIPRPANVCVIVCGGRSTNLQMLNEMEKKLSSVPNVASKQQAHQQQPIGLSKQLTHLLGGDSILAEIDDLHRDQNDLIDHLSDMQTSSSSGKSSPHNMTNDMTKALPTTCNSVEEHHQLPRESFPVVVLN